MALKKPVKKAKDLRVELYHGLVLEAAELEFAERGFELARMQRIADGAGLSVGTLYNLYPSKEALYLALHKKRSSVLTQRIVLALSGSGDAVQRIARAVDAHIAFSLEHPAYLRVQLRGATSWSSTPSHLPAASLKTWRSAIQAAVALCKQGIDEGVLVADDPLRMVRTIAGICQAHMVHWLEDDMREPATQVAAQLVATIERLYRATRGSQRGPR